MKKLCKIKLCLVADTGSTSPDRTVAVAVAKLGGLQGAQNVAHHR